MLSGVSAGRWQSWDMHPWLLNADYVAHCSSARLVFRIYLMAAFDKYVWA